MRRRGLLLPSWPSTHCDRRCADHVVKGRVLRILRENLDEIGIVGPGYVERSLQHAYRIAGGATGTIPAA